MKTRKVEIVCCVGCGRDTTRMSGICIQCSGGSQSGNAGRHRGYKAIPYVDSAEGIDIEDRDYVESI